MKNKRGLIACIVFLLVFAVITISRKTKEIEKVPYQRNEGIVFNTVYHITYQYASDLQAEIEDELHLFDATLSPFNKTSVITRVNENDTTVVLNEWFVNVFRRSQDVWKQTGGAFDPTVSPLINAWGFGFKQGYSLSTQDVDSLLQLVGMDKISLDNGKVKKQDPRMSLNFSAIAKGYAVDVVAALLASKGIENFLVEIGGELVGKGRNPKGECWQVGINKPEEDSESVMGEIEEIVAICDGAMATSGNYRNFRYENGKRIAHTIDPVSGYPVQHSLLSATVIAPDCMTADAYATAFMVMGVDKSLQLAEKLKLNAYLIYAVDSVNTGVKMTSGMKELIVRETH